MPSASETDPLADLRARARQDVSDAKRESARSVIRTLTDVVDIFKLHNGRFPSNVEGLSALVVQPVGANEWQGPYLKRVIADPWGRAYIYRYPGSHNPKGPDISSAGPDGIEGTADDIGNWGAN